MLIQLMIIDENKFQENYSKMIDLILKSNIDFLLRIVGRLVNLYNMNKTTLWPQRIWLLVFISIILDSFYLIVTSL